MENTTHKIIVIGSGPAGLTSAIYASRASLNPVVIEGAEFGGQLMQTTLVENFPGFPNGIQGPDLMLGMRGQAKNCGALFVAGDATRVDFSKRPFVVWVGEQEYKSQSIIIATGAKAKWLPLESAEKLRGRGVTACATCDAPFFKGQDVVVVGGGDTAVEEASYLSKFCNKIYLVNILDSLQASKAMQERILDKSQFEILLNSQVVEILGENKVTGVKIKNNKTQEEKILDVTGVFIAIGHNPASQIFKGQLDLESDGRIKVTENTKTSVPGVFVAGDVADSKYWQAIVASGYGCMSALDAETYLEQNGL